MTNTTIQIGDGPKMPVDGIVVKIASPLPVHLGDGRFYTPVREACGEFKILSTEVNRKWIDEQR